LQPAAFCRREVFDKFGPFNADFHYGFDWAFWCELARQGCRIKRMPQILAANRVYGETKTLSGSDERLNELKRINERYKTRWLSHAYYRYYLAELEGKNCRTFFDYLLMPLMLLLSYGTIIHHLRCFNKKIIFGLLPNSRFVLKEAFIKMPRLDYESINIRLRSHKNANQAVAVFSGGKLVDKFVFTNGELEINLSLHDSTEDVDMGLSFDAEYSQFKSFLSRWLFFYKPKYIAAEITSVVMS